MRRERTLIRSIASALPEWAKVALVGSKHWLAALPYYGTGRLCPVCNKQSRRFRTFGNIPRVDAQCAHCDSLERHRFLALYMSSQTDLFDGAPKKMLHVAPESCLEPMFRKQLGDDYLSADLFNPLAMVKMDITDIQYPDESFDVIYCSHVLEHVDDDRKAMSEFRRVLKSDGWAILLVPIFGETTYEDPSIVDPAERLKHFGQEDHVRQYGRDYVDRLRDAGFSVSVAEASELCQESDVVQMGLTPASGEIFFCTK